MIFWRRLKRARGGVERAWPEAARRLGFECQITVPRILGQLLEQKISIRLLSERRQDDEIPCTLFHVAFADPLPVPLHIARRRRRGGQAHEASSRPIVTGDPDFDHRLVVGGGDPDSIRAFLDQKRRKAVRDLFEAMPDCILDREGILCEQPGCANDPDEIVRTVRLMAAGAAALSRTG